MKQNTKTGFTSVRAPRIRKPKTLKQAVDEIMPYGVAAKARAKSNVVSISRGKAAKAPADAPAKAPTKATAKANARSKAKVPAVAVAVAVKAPAPIAVVVVARTPAVGKALSARAKVEADAAKGILPMVPDFSADTHKPYRTKLALIVQMIQSENIRGLEALPINLTSTSPKAMDKFRRLALIALHAQQAG